MMAIVLTLQPVIRRFLLSLLCANSLCIEMHWNSLQSWEVTRVARTSLIDAQWAFVAFGWRIYLNHCLRGDWLHLIESSIIEDCSSLKSHHGNFPTKDLTLRSFKSCIGRAFLHSWIVEGLLMYQIERNPFVNAHSFGYNMGGALPVQGGVRKSPIHGNNLAKWTHLQIPSRRRHYADYNGLNRRRTHCPH